MTSISALVVIYNASIDNVPSIEASIRSQYVSQVVVCDNSTIETDNVNSASRLGIDYVPMGGNKGLSAAYNAGVEKCSEDIVCIFDDDTEIGEDYFEAVFNLSINRNDWHIALPTVLSGEKILSPCVFDGLRAIPFSELGEIVDSSRLSGINSGMIVKKSVYENVHYDEALFLDLIDHKFIQDARLFGCGVVHLQGPVLRQNYSLQTDSKDSAINRYRIFSRDSRIFYSSAFKSRAYCCCMLAVRKMKLCLHYKTLAFMGSV